MDLGLKKRALTRLFELPAGLFMLRYENAEDRWTPPRIAISTLPGSAPIEFMFASRDHSRMLEPTDVVVFRLDGDATVALMLLIDEHATSEVVNLKLERLDKVGGPAERVDAPEQVEAAPSGPVAQPRITLVKTDGVLASEMAVEALTVAWPGRPQGAEIEYALEVERLGWCPSAITGSIAGTRGRKLGVLGASFQLQGDAPAGLELEVRAAFARSGIKTLRGRSVVIAGEGEGDVLLSLGLTVQSRAGAPAGKGVGEATLLVA